MTALTLTGSLLATAVLFADAPISPAQAQAVKDDDKNRGKGKGDRQSGERSGRKGGPQGGPQGGPSGGPKGGPPPSAKKGGPPPVVKAPPPKAPPPVVKAPPPKAPPPVVKKAPPPPPKAPPPVVKAPPIPPKAVPKVVVPKGPPPKAPTPVVKAPPSKPDLRGKSQEQIRKEFMELKRRQASPTPPVNQAVPFKKGPPPPPRPRLTATERPQKPAPWQYRDLNQLKGQRKEVRQGNRVIIEEPDRRRIYREDGRTFIRHDETERFRRQWKDTRTERRGGLDISITVLPGGYRLYTEYDNDRRPLRRYRRGPDGRDVVLYDNRAFYRRYRGNDWYRHAFVTLPPLALSIPRRDYIVEYDEASPDDIYGALDAPPLGDFDRRYSLEEIRYSPSLRDRLRRVDLSSVNFEFGSWEIDEGQYRKLERLADAMSRIIDQDSSEMFLIEGHTDAVGEDDDNLTLSDRRAESVALVLTQEFGIPSENMTTQGYGEENLKVPTDGPDPRNRYVAVRRITPLLDR